jgi:hypothetical protein
MDSPFQPEVFSSCSILASATPAILKQNFVEFGERARTTCNSWSHCLSWLAGDSVPWGGSTWQPTHLIYRNETWFFFLPQIESWNSEYCDRVLGKSPNISNQTIFLIQQFDHKKLYWKTKKKKSKQNKTKPTKLNNVSERTACWKGLIWTKLITAQ